jgi:uncharacterized membrane protein
MSASPKSPRRGRASTKVASTAVGNHPMSKQTSRATKRKQIGQPGKDKQINQSTKGKQARESVSQLAEQAGGTWRRPWTLPQSVGWLQFSTLVLCIFGLVDSGYQTYTHFTDTGLLGCSAKADACVTVQTSSYAYVFGIPVAALGLAFYAFMVVICSPQAWRSKMPAIRLARLTSVIIGILFVLYLVYAELIKIGRICPYCTSVHIITFVLFSLIVFDAAVAKPVGPQ